MNEETNTTENSNSTPPQLLCGDIVIHPTRPWPWLGTVNPKSIDFTRMCSNCGGLCVTLDFSQSQLDIPMVIQKCDMTCGNCCEEIVKQEITTGEETAFPPLPKLALNIPSLASGLADKLNNEEMSALGFDKILNSSQENNALNKDDLNSFNNAESSTNNNLDDAQKAAAKKYQINWFPVGEFTDVDGNEVVVIPVKQHSLFQEGHPVMKKDKSTVGLVKQVHQQIDAFILPDYKTLVCDVPSERFFPVSPFENLPGCYIIHKGWVGTIFNVYNRIYFRLDDGTEFYVNDDENERIYAHLKETAKQSCCDMRQLFPGQSLKIRWCLLEKAVWANGQNELSEDLRQKINKSRENFMKDGNPLHKFSCDEEQLEMEFRDKFGANSVVNFDTALVSKVAKGFIESVVNSMSNEKQSQDSKGATNADENNKNNDVNDDWTQATVTKIEPLKIDVEWISQVVSDPNLAESSMKTNYIEGDDVKNITSFRACRAYESFEMGSRFKCTLQSTDRLMTSEKWRRKMLNDDETNDFMDHNDDNCSSAVDNNEVVCVSVAKTVTKIDVLWEDGSFETNVDLSDVSAQYSHPVDRDYFPAMYVLLQGGAQASSSSATNDEVTRKKSSNSKHDEISNENFALKHGSPGRFGVVRSSRNAEKYATVDWYDYKVNENDVGQIEEPKKVKTEDVSFYDLKFFHDFNYVSGTLVSLVKPTSSTVPNVGYVRRKNADGTVLVIWYDGREEILYPWKLKQLNSRMYYSDYSGSEAGNEHYYSPTEQEYEDLEDFRYYDYSSLNENQRHKRVALIVVVLQEVIPRLVRAIVFAYKYYSTLDRKKFVKLTLSTNDVMNGFAHMAEFRDCLKDVYDNETDLMQKQNQTKSAAGWSRNIFREEKLVWQCANWLYDWTEAMSTLQEDIRKDQYRLLMVQKHSTTQQQQQSFSSKHDAKRAKTESFDVETSQNDEIRDEFFADTLSDDDNFASMDVDDPLGMELIELLHSIETGLSTVTGILAVPSTSDVASGLILEYVNNCRKENNHDNVGGSTSKIDNNNVVYADLTTSHTFLLKLLSNSNKSTRLPCFSFAHRSDQDLADLRSKWKIQTLKSGRLKRVNDDVKSENDEINAQIIIERVNSFVESVLNGVRDVSCREDDVLQICHEIADGLCLSTLSVLNAVVNRIGSRLSTDIAKLFETPVAVEASASSTTIDAEQLANSSLDSTVIARNRLDSIKSTPSIDDDRHPGGVILHGCFEVMPTAPLSQRFLKKTLNETNLPKSFFTAIRREMKLLQTSLPSGIFVKTYEDRMDLFSCMIVGPQGTPYADGLFFFDVRLRDDYPGRPPHVFFKSMCKSLNPNLYEDGMVCLSLLGTWDGKEVELWSPTSTLLQVFVSIQSLILVSEPYFNEPGFEKEKGSATGATKSRDYNESAVLRTLESMKRILASPPEPFRPEILRHVKENGPRLMKLLEIYQQPDGDNSTLSFPLFPVTQGFCLCIKRHATTLLEAMENFVANEDNDSKK